MGKVGAERGRVGVFFFNDTATTEIYTLSLHDALPIFLHHEDEVGDRGRVHGAAGARPHDQADHGRSEEHTSELQSRQYLVCRLLLEKKKISVSHSLSSTITLFRIVISNSHTTYFTSRT